MLNNRFIPYNSFVHSHLIKYSIAKNREKSKSCQPAVPHLSSEKIYIENTVRFPEKTDGIASAVFICPA